MLKVLLDVFGKKEKVGKNEKYKLPSIASIQIVPSIIDTYRLSNKKQKTS